jgi:hypothetical protein
MCHLHKKLSDLSVRPSICLTDRWMDELHSFCLSFRQVQIHCQNQDWMQGLEVSDDFSFRIKKTLPDLTNLTGRLSSPNWGFHPQTPAPILSKSALSFPNFYYRWDKCCGGTNVRWYKRRWDKCQWHLCWWDKSCATMSRGYTIFASF